MDDTAKKNPETDAEKIAAMKKFERNCGPMRFIRECTPEEYIAAQKKVQEAIDKKLGECLDRIILDLKKDATT